MRRDAESSPGTGRLARICALLALVTVAAVADADEAGVRGWFERMSRAARMLDYDGTFVYRSGDFMQSLRVIHRGRGSERERLITLSGATREVVRDADTVTCILPESQRVLIGTRRGHGIGASSVFDVDLLQDTAASHHYDFDSAQGERVAGRETRLIRIVPRDRFRYGYRLFADQATGLMLKSQLVDGQGPVLEEVVFTTLSLPHSIPDASLAAQLPTDGYHRVRIEGVRKDAISDARQAWQVGWLPRGFALSEHARDAFLPDRRGVHHLVYSDGLAFVSVFIEPDGGAQAPAEGGARLGAVSAFVDRLGGHRVTVMGEVPPATVERVARSVRLN